MKSIKPLCILLTNPRIIITILLLISKDKFKAEAEQEEEEKINFLLKSKKIIMAEMILTKKLGGVLMEILLVNRAFIRLRVVSSDKKVGIDYPLRLIP